MITRCRTLGQTDAKTINDRRPPESKTNVQCDTSLNLNISEFLYAAWRSREFDASTTVAACYDDISRGTLVHVGHDGTDSELRTVTTWFFVLKSAPRKTGKLLGVGKVAYAMLIICCSFTFRLRDCDLIEHLLRFFSFALISKTHSKSMKSNHFKSGCNGSQTDGKKTTELARCRY